MRLSFKLPSWLLKSNPRAKGVGPRTKKANTQAKLPGPPQAMWVGWPMDESFNPNILDAAHDEMMQVLGRV